MRGRPRTGRKKVIRSFAISKDLNEQLQESPNASWTVNQALRSYYKKRRRPW